MHPTSANGLHFYVKGFMTLFSRLPRPLLLFSLSRLCLRKSTAAFLRHLHSFALLLPTLSSHHIGSLKLGTRAKRTSTSKLSLRLCLSSPLPPPPSSSNSDLESEEAAYAHARTFRCPPLFHAPQRQRICGKTKLIIWTSGIGWCMVDEGSRRPHPSPFLHLLLRAHTLAVPDSRVREKNIN